MDEKKINASTCEAESAAERRRNTPSLCVIRARLWGNFSAPSHRGSGGAHTSTRRARCSCGRAERSLVRRPLCVSLLVFNRGECQIVRACVCVSVDNPPSKIAPQEEKMNKGRWGFKGAAAFVLMTASRVIVWLEERRWCGWWAWLRVLNAAW